MTAAPAETGTDVAKVQEAPIAARKREIAALRPEFERAIGDPRLAERFVRVALTAVSRTPQLGDCTSDSLLGALLTCSVLRLEPNDPRGLAYLIPFRNNKARTTEAQLIIGYKGLIDLAYRSNQIKTLAAEAVHTNDYFQEQRWPRHLVHRAAEGDRGEVVRYYAAVEYKDGGQDFTVMSVEEIEKHRDLYSRGWDKRDDSPWKTAPDAMAKKTVIRRLAKYMPLSVEDLRQFHAAVNADGAVITAGAVRSVEDLMGPLERPEADAIDVQAQTSRVTAAEIGVGGPETPQQPATPEVGEGAADAPAAADQTIELCQGGCGGAPHSPTECPGAPQLDLAESAADT